MLCCLSRRRSILIKCASFAFRLWRYAGLLRLKCRDRLGYHIVSTNGIGSVGHVSHISSFGVSDVDAERIERAAGYDVELKLRGLIGRHRVHQVRPRRRNVA